MNNIYLIYEKYPCQWEINDYLYAAIGKDEAEVIKLCDIDIPSDFEFEIIKETRKSPRILLEFRQCDYGHTDIFEIQGKLKLHKKFFKYRFYGYNDHTNKKLDQIRKMLK